MKKLLKKLSLALLITALITTQTQAALNTQNLAGTTLLSAGALTTVMALAGGVAVAATGGLALAAFGGLLLLTNTPSSNSTKENSPITIQLNPKIPLVTPPGWTPPVPPATQPTPPSNTTMTPYQWTANNTTGTSNSLQTACTDQSSALNNFYASQNQGVVITYKSSSSPANCVYSRTQNGAAISDLLVAITAPTCPTGYTLSGTSPNQTCNLSNSNLVIKPVMGKQTIVRTGNTFATDSKINPTDVLPPEILTVTPTEITANDSNGTLTKVKLNTDGTSTLTISEPTNNGTNTTNITTINYSAPNTSTGDVTVTGINKQIGSGTGTAASTTPPPSTSSGSGQSIDISSLNKESTQQAIKLNTDAIKDALKCDDCELPADVTEENQTKINDEIKKLTGMLEKVDEDYAGFKDLGWSNWVPTFPSSTCSPINGDIAGQHVSWDFCPHIAKLNELLGWLMNLFGAWTITGMFFKRE